MNEQQLRFQQVGIPLLLTVFGFALIAVNAFAAEDAAETPSRREISAKYVGLAKELARKQADDSVALMDELKQRDASAGSRKIRLKDLSERQRLEKKWLANAKNEEFCARLAERCEKLTVREFGANDESIPDYASNGSISEEWMN